MSFEETEQFVVSFGVKRPFGTFSSDRRRVMKKIEECSLGERIAHFRIIHTMSQEDLAMALHVTRQAVSNYECNKRQPSPGTLSAIAEIFDISLDMLMKGQEFQK